MKDGKQRASYAAEHHTRHPRLKESLTIQDAEDILDQRIAGEQVLQEDRQDSRMEGGYVEGYATVVYVKSLATIVVYAQKLQKRQILQLGISVKVAYKWYK
jgi:hypothetical protein